MSRRLTHREFCQRVNRLTHSQYKVLSRYKGMRIKVKLQCPKGHITEIYPNNIMHGHLCSVCGNNRIGIKAHLAAHVNGKAYQKAVAYLTNDKYKVIGDYVNSKTKIKMLDPKGDTFWIRPDMFIRGYKASNYKPGRTSKKGVRLMSKYTKTNRNRFNQKVAKSDDMKVDYFKSGGFCFPSVVLSEQHYLRLPNVARYLQMDTEAFRHLVSRKRGYVTATKSDLKQIASKLLFRHKSVHVSLVSAKSLHQLLVQMGRRKYKCNYDHVNTLKHDLNDTYGNEIKGLTNVQLKLENHNKRVAELNKKAAKADKLANHDFDITKIDSKIQSNLKKILKLQKSNVALISVKKAKQDLEDAFKNAADKGIVLE